MDGLGVILSQDLGQQRHALSQPGVQQLLELYPSLRGFSDRFGATPKCDYDRS